MNGVELKLYLKDNPSLIEQLLESVGCENIVFSSNKITCSNPDGDNFGAVNVMLNDTLNCVDFTRSDYDKYKIKDIITLMQFFLNEISINKTIKYIQSICGIEKNVSLTRQDNTIHHLKQLKRSLQGCTECSDDPIDENLLNEFLDVYINIFLSEGIDYKIQNEFEIKYDLNSNSIVIPIRNYKGDLITFKLRTLFKDYKELGLPKYRYLYNFSGKYYLYGEFENQKYIKESDCIFVFEAEKSVLQAASFGYRNCVAISKHDISRQQINRILSYNKPIILAFDKDIKISEVLTQCRKFRGMQEIYYIFDTDGYLTGKSSPTDFGLYIFEMLNENCKFSYEEE